MIKVNNISLFVFFFLFLYLFIIYDANFRGPDQPIYFTYTASVVDDGDLNVVNQVDFKHYPQYLTSGKIGVSKTYNLPDFHNHGGVILWVPFYAYAKFIHYVAAKFNLTALTNYGFDRITRCAMSFSTIVFGFFTLFFTYFLCRAFFSDGVALWSTLVIFLGTPFFYFLSIEIGNANIIASLFSILSIWFCSYAMSMKKLHWFLYGLFFSICTVIKTELWFQLVFILSFFLVLILLKHTTWKNIIYFFIGIAPVFMLRIINGYIKYGTLHIGELKLFSLKNFYFFEQIFSSYRGFFYTSPIFYICLLGVVFLIINLVRNTETTNGKKIQNLFLSALALYLVIKIFILTFRYAWGGGTPGARLLLAESPVFILLYAQAMDSKRKYLTYFIAMVSVFFVFWNLLIISEYMTGIDLKYITEAPALSVRIKMIKKILDCIFRIRDLDLKLSVCIPLVFSVFGITFYAAKFMKQTPLGFCYNRNQSEYRVLRLFTLFTAYLCASYIIITSLNVYNNQKNAEKLKAEGFFGNASIIAPCEFEKSENVGSMNEMIQYFELRGDSGRVNRIRALKEEIYGEADK